MTRQSAHVLIYIKTCPSDHFPIPSMERRNAVRQISVRNTAGVSPEPPIPPPWNPPNPNPVPDSFTSTNSVGKLASFRSYSFKDMRRGTAERASEVTPVTQGFFEGQIVQIEATSRGSVRCTIAFDEGDFILKDLASSNQIQCEQVRTYLGPPPQNIPSGQFRMGDIVRFDTVGDPRLNQRARNNAFRARIVVFRKAETGSSAQKRDAIGEDEAPDNVSGGLGLRSLNA